MIKVVAIIAAITALCYLMFLIQLLWFKMGKNGKLIKLVKSGDLDGVVTALENDANVNIKTPGTGKTAIMIAAAKGNLKMVETLLERGANVNGAIFEAVNHGEADVVELFLNRGVDPNICNKFGTPVLYVAAKKRELIIVEALLAKGADPDYLFTVQYNKDSDKGVCPSVVRQLVKEILESKKQLTCALCGNLSKGVCRDFVIYQSENISNYSMGAKVTTKISTQIDEVGVFLCNACIKSRSKRFWLPQNLDEVGKEVVEKTYQLSDGKNCKSKEQWIRDCEYSRQKEIVRE